MALNEFIAHTHTRTSLPSLIQVYDEHNIISKTGQSMKGRHSYDESKYVINEGVKCLQQIIRVNHTCKYTDFCKSPKSPQSKSKLYCVKFFVILKKKRHVTAYLVRERSPRKMRHRFQLVVEK